MRLTDANGLPIHLNAAPDVTIEHGGRKYVVELNFYMGPMPLDARGEARPDGFASLPDAVRAEAKRLYRERYPRKS